MRPGARHVPPPLFWVVDRRSVVDQVYEHARRVTALISSAQNDGLVAAVRDQLEQITGGTVIGGPVQVRLRRGGLDSEPTGSTPKLSNGSSDATRFASTAELRLPLSPIAPAVVCSTVDQVGSRLLFRGYGVSRRSRPIEAALVGTDSLIVLDEAHLSVAFEKTTKAIADIQRSTPEHQRRVQVMSATATRTRTESSAHIFHLTPAELDDPAIAIRRRAKRPATLMPASNATHACIAAARELADERSSGVIGVVANTVSSARRIADALSMHGAMLLIIGRARGLDREDLALLHPSPRQARQVDGASIRRWHADARGRAGC